MIGGECAIAAALRFNDMGGAMTKTKRTVLLKHRLKALQLPTVLGKCEKVAVRCAAENVNHLSFPL